MTIRVDTLSNGFRIATERMPALASATIGVWVEVGSRHESADQNGIAHFLEHMAFKGTKRRSALRIAEEIEDVGGHLNAYTSRERTAYYARVLQADVPLALDMLADILRASVMEPRDIEVERGVILQEICQALDTPDDIIFDWLQETAFPDQPLGRSILGPAERIRSYGRNDILGFVTSHYRPDRMILAAAGAVDHNLIMRQAEELFGDMNGGAQMAADPARYSGGECRVEKSLEQAHFALGLNAPSYRDDEYHAAQIAAVALGGGMSSRLFQEVRERRGLCYTIFAQGSAWSETGMMTVYAGTGADQLGELVDLTVDEIVRAASDLNEEEIARARAQVKAGLVMGLESPSARAERMAAQLSVWGRVIPLEETVSRIEAVNVVGARAALQHMLESSPALALYGRVEAARNLDGLAARLAA